MKFGLFDELVHGVFVFVFEVLPELSSKKEVREDVA